MDKEKAKFILGAYQAGLPQAEEDVEMSAALEEARHDPELGDWLRREMEFDERVGAAFRRIEVPSGLRRSILEGMELSAERRAWWRRPFLLLWGGGLTAAAAAALTFWLSTAQPAATGLPGGGGGVVSVTPAGYEPWQVGALNTLKAGFQFELEEPDRSMAQGWLIGKGLPVPESVLTKVDDGQLIGCLTLRNVPAFKTSTICMRSKDGPVVHVVSQELPPLAAHQGSEELGAPMGKPRLGNFGNFNTLSWREPGKGIMLVTEAPADVLQRFVRGE
jgi:hypothetical protein